MATKIVNTLIFIFAMNIKIGWADQECADCHKTSDRTCEIVADPGFSCGVFKIRKLPRDTVEEWEDAAAAADEKVPEVTKDLDVCVPDGLNMTGTEEFPICCVWSNELGCQIIVNELNDLWDCGVCRKNMHINYDGLKPCPCETFVVIEDEEDGGSRNVYCGSWHVVTAIYCIFALFKL